ncbi:MAG: PGF-pre-PGF domain-containing protein [Candidatus Aenigmatarchaeota archaeon]
MKVFYILPLVFVLFAVAHASSPYFFKGYVFVNGSLAPNGTIVEVYVNSGSSAANAFIVGQGAPGQGPLEGAGRYLISFVANSGDSVTFRVNNLSLNSANGTNTSAQAISSSLTENFNLSANKTANGVSCLYAIGCSSGFCADSYCCNTACTDSNYDCNVAGSLGTCTSTATTTTTGGTGGGGTGVAAASETQTLSSVTAGSTASVSISQSASLGIEKIEFTTSTALTNAQITVKETTAASAGVSVAIASTEGAVYKYLEITKTNIQDSGISSAKISFKVPRSWFTANNIDKATVALNRFSNSAWSKLPTTVSSEDSSYVYFAATSPGFSTFAITGEKAQPSVTSFCGNNTREGSEGCDGTDLAGQTCVSKGYASGTLKCTNCVFDVGGCVSAPSLTITLPTGGQIIYGATVTVTTSVSGFTLAAPTGTVVEGEGHLHMFLDDRAYVLSSASSYTFDNVPYGQHTLRVELHRGDHSALSPPVTKTVTFSTAQQAVQPLSPTPPPEKTDYTIVLVVILIILVVGYFFMKKSKIKK